MDGNAAKSSGMGKSIGGSTAGAVADSDDAASSALWCWPDLICEPLETFLNVTSRVSSRSEQIRHLRRLSESDSNTEVWVN